MIDEREKIAYAKRELRSQRYLKARCEYLKMREEEIWTQLMGIKSISIEHEGGGYDPFQKARLYDDLELVKNERDYNKQRLQRIDDFMTSLELSDKNSLYNIYIKRNSRTLENEAISRNYSRQGFIKRIDKILEDF